MHASVGLFARVSLQKLAIDVLAISFVARREIFLDGYHQSTGAE